MLHPKLMTGQKLSFSPKNHQTLRPGIVCGLLGCKFGHQDLVETTSGISWQHSCTEPSPFTAQCFEIQFPGDVRFCSTCLRWFWRPITWVTALQKDRGPGLTSSRRSGFISCNARQQCQRERERVCVCVFVFALSNDHLMWKAQLIAFHSSCQGIRCVHASFSSVVRYCWWPNHVTLYPTNPY